MRILADPRPGIIGLPDRDDPGLSIPKAMDLTTKASRDDLPPTRLND